jgi:serine/threonine protein kinase
MVGRRVLHFDILEKFGEGGMGVVFKARDTSLDRFVALKVLPADKVSDPERRRRFVVEAKAAMIVLDLQELSKRRYVDPVLRAYLLASMGRKEDALAALEEWL